MTYHLACMQRWFEEDGYDRLFRISGVCTVRLIMLYPGLRMGYRLFGPDWNEYGDYLDRSAFGKLVILDAEPSRWNGRDAEDWPLVGFVNQSQLEKILNGAPEKVERLINRITRTQMGR